jgi:hypothetical protein
VQSRGLEERVSVPKRPRQNTRPWTCLACRSSWNLIFEESEIPEDAARYPKCGKPPSGFAPGQVVRVNETNNSRTRLGVVDEA